MSELRTTRRDLAKWMAAGAGITTLPSAPALARTASSIRLGVANATVEWRRDPAGIDTRRPRFRWTLTAPEGARNVRQGGFRIRLIAGPGAAAAAGSIVFDSGPVQSDALTWQPPRDLPLRPQANYEWRIAIHSADADPQTATEHVAGRFTTGLLDPKGWKAAWIAAERDSGPLSGRDADQERSHGRVMPLFRRDFSVPRNVVAAYLSIAGLGHHACFLNGQDIQPDALSGGWTDFATTVLYDTHDVTAHLKPGANTLAVMLGNGFFVVEKVAGRYTKLTRSGGALRVIAQLRLIFADGSEQLVTSDADWRTRAGPITYSSIYGGEDHDARRIAADWTTAPAGDGWEPVHVIDGPGGTLVANPVPAVARARVLTPTAVTPLSGGRLVYDFGLNFAGRPRLVLRGAKAGQRVRLWPGELLLDNGSIDQHSMTESQPGRRGIFFEYIARGDAEEVWEPRFTYTGYRYLEVEGALADQIATLEGCVLHAGLDQTGSFDCADARLNSVHKLIEQALVSNMASVLTDCPQREKLGWLEQIYLNAATVTINRDAVTLYEKMAGDMRASQQPSGMVPSIAPEYAKFLNGDGSDGPFRDSPEWGSAIVLGPWTVYRTYGDAGILHQNWAAMNRYADYLSGRAKDGLVSYGLGDWFDIGPRPSGYAQLTSLAMTATATLYADLDALAQMAAIIGRSAEARTLAARAEAVRSTINARLYDPARGSYDRGSQAANAMALALHIVAPADRPRVLANLIAAIRERNDHVSAGDIGFHYVVRALIEAGRGDVLYDMLKRTDAPSYLAQIQSGATALTEAWDGWRGKSQNHFMLGHIEQWFYGGLGGLDIDFARTDGPPILIAPQPVPGLTSAKVRFVSVSGPVACEWEATAAGFDIKVELPAGTQGRIRLPTRDVGSVREGGRVLAQVPGLKPAAIDPLGLSIDLGSGRYAFTVARA